MHDLLNQPRLSLLVTDSGLGGLSICADMVRILIRQRLVSDLSVVYFNAWPLQDKGYNFLDGDATRIRVFGNAIRAMNRYAPDLIVIACNTLSVVFQQGNLAATACSPVVDIITFGVDMIAAKLHRRPQSTALILGTQTTVSSGVHKKLLMDRGIAERRITQQNCHGLAGAIERDPHSPQVRALVERFMAEAAAALPSDTDHIYAALCCTHYGYSQQLIGDSLARHTGAKVDIVNPNQGMSDFVKVAPANRRFHAVNLNVRVVSRVRLAAQTINSISSRVDGVCPQMAYALNHYEWIPDLFDV